MVDHNMFLTKLRGPIRFMETTIYIAKNYGILDLSEHLEYINNC